MLECGEEMVWSVCDGADMVVLILLLPVASSSLLLPCECDCSTTRLGNELGVDPRRGIIEMYLYTLAH